MVFPVWGKWYQITRPTPVWVKKFFENRWTDRGEAPPPTVTYRKRLAVVLICSYDLVLCGGGGDAADYPALGAPRATLGGDYLFRASGCIRVWKLQTWDRV